MVKHLFHAWERRLASVTTDRVVRPFEWGLDWIPCNGHPPGTSEAEILRDWVHARMADSDAFCTPAGTDDYRTSATDTGDILLRFPSAFTTPHAEPHTVSARSFPEAAAS